MDILENQTLHSYVTMGLGGPAKFLVVVNNEPELEEAVKFAKHDNLPIMVIGKGSNIVFSDKGFDGLVIINDIKLLDINPQTGVVNAGAGEDWDNFVEKTVKAGLIGVESLSLIPGTVGAAPINNIGAYGQEVKNTITMVRAYDTEVDSFVELSNEDCSFKYRSSLFKNQLYGRYIITKISFKLEAAAENYTPPTYASIQSLLTERGNNDPSPQEIRDLIIEVRTNKLPDPAVTPNSGSFFKNPIVSVEKRDELLAVYPDLVYFDYHGQAKLAAGWLIDKAGLKGFEKDGIKIYDKQALVLVNLGTRSYESLDNMIRHIQNTVYGQFGVTLEPEPELK